MSKKTEGLYAYCIVSACPKIDQMGIDSENKVYAISYKDISALVSKVALSDFEIEEKKAKGEEGMEWIKKMALAHEVIVETLMKTCQPLLPMKFCTIFKGRKQLEGVLKNKYLDFKLNLERLKDKEEWGIKMYCDLKKFKENFNLSSRPAKAASGGAAYLLGKKREDEVSQAADQKMMDYAREVHERVKNYALRTILNAPLPKKVTERKEEMILNGAYLISKEKVPQFEKEAEGLQNKYGKIGLEITCIGPWPPYNFVEIGSEAKQSVQFLEAKK